MSVTDIFNSKYVLSWRDMDMVYSKLNEGIDQDEEPPSSTRSGPLQERHIKV